MGNIKFVATYDNTQVVNGFDEIVNTVKSGSTKVKSEFKNTAKVINDEFSKVKPIPQPVSLEKLNLVRQLKKEIQTLTSEAIAAGEGTKKWSDALAEAGKKKGEMKDLQAAIASLDPDIKARAFTGLAQAGVESLHGIAGAMALAGIKSEDYEKVIVRLQGLQGLSAGIAGITDLKDKWTEAKLALGTYISKIEAKIIADKIQQATVLTGEGIQTEASIAAVAGIEAQAAATAEATIIQRIWNVVQASSPWGIAAVAIGVLVTVIGTYISQSETAKKAEEARSTALDGTIIKNKELRDEYNKHIVALKGIDNAYAVLNGSMTKFEADMSNLTEQYKADLLDITNETKAQLIEQDGFWTQLWMSIKGGGTPSGLVQANMEATTGILQDGADKAEEIRLKDEEKRKELLEKQVEETKKAAEEEMNANIELAKRTTLLLDETIKDEHQRKIKQIQDNAEFAIRDLEDSKANQFVKAEAIAAINKKMNFDIQAENDAHDQKEIDRRNKANAEILAIQKAADDALLAEEERLNQQMTDMNLAREAREQSDLQRFNTLKTKLDSENAATVEKNRVQQFADDKKLLQLELDRKVINYQEYFRLLHQLEEDFNKGSAKDKELLTAEEKKQLKQTFDDIKKATDDIIQAQQEAIDRQKQINDDKIAENDRYLGVLATQLGNEQKERDAGHANNFEATEAAIRAEKEQRLKNLEDQKRIQAEQAKLNKIKIIEDKATQASALISAAANIIKGWSTLPFIGQVLGVAQIAALLVSFGSFAKKAQGFAKGTKHAPPGLKWVGEEGPELIDDAGGYRIFTNKESNSIVENYKSFNFTSKIPKFDYGSMIPAMQNGKPVDTKGIESRIDKSNQLLEKGMNKESISYSGNRKIISSGNSTIISKELNGRR